MAVYMVYRVRFRIRKGTVRLYIGYTKCLSVRRAYHNQKPPAWLKCRNRQSELSYTILEEGITALALEALLAARATAAAAESS